MKLSWKTSEILSRYLYFCSWLGVCLLTVTKWNSSQDFWEGRNRQALKKAGVNFLPVPAKTYTQENDRYQGTTQVVKLDQETQSQPEPLGQFSILSLLKKHRGFLFFQVDPEGPDCQQLDLRQPGGSFLPLALAI